MNITIIITLTTMYTTGILNPNASVTNPPAKTCETMAVQLIEVLKRQSSEEFISLFPTEEQFLDAMKKNSSVYGDFLSDAEAEFKHEYNERVIPGMVRGFEELLYEGDQKGIVWSEIKLAEVEMAELSNPTFGEAKVHVFIHAGGQIHRMDLNKSLVIDGFWYVSPTIALN